VTAPAPGPADLTPRPPSLAGKGERRSTAVNQAPPFPRRDGGPGGLGEVLETKFTIDGRAQTFTCAGLLLTPRLAMVRFDHADARRTGGYEIPAGSYTIGFFWRGRGYNCYRFTRPDGSVIAYRFDAVERVGIRPGRVWYHDLLLDVLIGPDGAVWVEDEDEVEEATAGGLLSPAQQQRIERTKALLLRGHARIIAECEREVARL
jgi:predicted RNA-binding protein associated with RNAse of E/G family